jgi:hypothetical protein
MGEFAVTGLLVRQYQGGAPVYKVDTGLVSLIGQLLAHEKQAAEELGQWTGGPRSGSIPAAWESTS